MLTWKCSGSQEPGGQSDESLSRPGTLKLLTASFEDKNLLERVSLEGRIDVG